jgi:hypothetical protein
LILELSKEEAYENFAYCTVCNWGSKQTKEEFWQDLENDIEWARNHIGDPIENPYWHLVSICADGFYILDTVLLD